MSSRDLLIPAIGSILERDLNSLRREVEAYRTEAELWRTVPGISNSAGTLVLHAAGNLQHFLGACLGRTGYVRNRAAEFSRRNVPREELIQEIDAAVAGVRAGLAALTPAQLSADFPEAIADARLTTGEYLIHLTTHLAYHLGQVDYHRRILSGADAVVGAMRPAELSSARPVSKS